MTHERAPGDEPDGPEADLSLPDAASIPVADGPDELAPLMPPEFSPLPRIEG